MTTLPSCLSSLPNSNLLGLCGEFGGFSLYCYKNNTPIHNFPAKDINALRGVLVHKNKIMTSAVSMPSYTPGTLPQDLIEYYRNNWESVRVSVSLYEINVRMLPVEGGGWAIATTRTIGETVPETVRWDAMMSAQQLVEAAIAFVYNMSFDAWKAGLDRNYVYSLRVSSTNCDRYVYGPAPAYSIRLDNMTHVKTGVSEITPVGAQMFVLDHVLRFETADDALDYVASGTAQYEGVVFETDNPEFDIKIWTPAYAAQYLDRQATTSNDKAALTNVLRGVVDAYGKGDMFALGSDVFADFYCWFGKTYSLFTSGHQKMAGPLHSAVGKVHDMFVMDSDAFDAFSAGEHDISKCCTTAELTAESFADALFHIESNHVLDVLSDAYHAYCRNAARRAMKTAGRR